MGEPKKHHFVPQFLLRGFLPPEQNQLYVFDKWTGRTWRSGTRDAGAEHKFNVVEFKGRRVDLESFMGRMEDVVAPMVDKLRRTRSIRWLTKVDRRHLALFVAAQKLRTPAALAQQKAIDDLLQERLLESGASLDSVSGYRPLQPGEEKAFWGEFYVTEAPKIATHLQMKDWMLLEPESGTDRFYISDAPVSLFNDVETPFRGNLGVACEGIQIHLPVSDTLTLAMLCPTIVRDMVRGRNRARKMLSQGIGEAGALLKATKEAKIILEAVRNGRPLKCAPENVTHLNSLQVSGSERFIYSSNGSFDLVTEMITTHPINRVGRRPQIA